MAWPVTDFDNVQFNDGSGYAEVVAIHLAIKERADATAHTLKNSAPYNDVYDGTTLWLADPDANGARRYLKDQLQDFYDAIEDLVSGDSRVRWTESSGDTTEWTMASLVTAIGMGDWADLLTKPANHEPFLWLHEALDRLIYAKVTRFDTDSGADTIIAGFRQFGDTPQQTWDRLGDDNFSGVSNSVGWSLTVSGGAQVHTTNPNFNFATAELDGVLVVAKLKANVSWANTTLTSLSVSADSDTYTLTGAVTNGLYTYTGASLASNTTPTLTVDTAVPSTVPFTAFGGFVDFTVLSLLLHIDLATILEDQS